MSEEKTYTIEELKKKLTEKESIFCHQYIIDWNGSRAAREAGYSENRARQSSYDLVTKSYISQYIDFIKKDYEKEAGLTKLSQLKSIIKIIEDKDSTARDIISAIAEANKMMGYLEPEKHNIKFEGKKIKLNFD